MAFMVLLILFFFFPSKNQQAREEDTSFGDQSGAFFNEINEQQKTVTTTIIEKRSGGWRYVNLLLGMHLTKRKQYFNFNHNLVFFDLILLSSRYYIYIYVLYYSYLI